MINLDAEYSYLIDEIRVGSIANNKLQITEFFDIYSRLSADNGDTPDLEYCPILKEGQVGFRVDGYAFDIKLGENGESGDLYLVVCDYRQSNILATVNSRDIERAVNGARKFFIASNSRAFIDSLEETSPAYQLAILIHQYINKIKRLRIIVFTNGHLKIRKNKIDGKELNGIEVHVNVLDIERYAKMSSITDDLVEIDFENDFSETIECLPAYIGIGNYKSYLFAMKGTTLAEIYSRYGGRLLEQNVRSYLQAKTGVNKGILRTISNEPEMFFAYNNGITATASSVDVKKNKDNILTISYIKNFQIVNGGQTTASLLYARDTLGKKLDSVYIQVKLSEVEIQNLGFIVPKISEYANTQNKVSLSDLASNSPIQVRIERLSKESKVPIKAGELHVEHWFYERARGQYKNLFAYKTKSDKTKLQLTYPKNKLVTKTDLAKYELSFAGRPHHVSEGAQKCFNRYTTSILSKYDDCNLLDQEWFNRMMAKALLFISLDEEIQKSLWYKQERGYKAQIVTYTVAACAFGFNMKDYHIDLDRIWKEQCVSSGLLNWMLENAQSISSILKKPPEKIRNISEFAKRDICWEQYVKGKIGIPDDDILKYGVSKSKVNYGENSI